MRQQTESQRLTRDQIELLIRRGRHRQGQAIGAWLGARLRRLARRVAGRPSRRSEASAECPA